MRKPGKGGNVLPDTKGIKRTRLLTKRHIDVIKNYVKNGGEGGMKKAMLQAGYSKSTAMQPVLLTRNPEFRKVLNEVLSKDMIIQCLNDDILAKPGNRVQELALASKIRGMLIDKSEHLNKNINIDISEAIAKKNNLLETSTKEEDNNLLESSQETKTDL